MASRLADDRADTLGEKPGTPAEAARPEATSVAGRSAHVLNSFKNAATRHSLLVGAVDAGLETAAEQAAKDLVATGMKDVDAQAAAYRAQRAARVTLVGRNGEFSKWGVNPHTTQIAGRRAAAISNATLKLMKPEQAKLVAQHMGTAAETIGKQLGEAAKQAMKQQGAVEAIGGARLISVFGRWALPGIGVGFAAADTVRAAELAVDPHATKVQKIAGGVAAAASIASAVAVVQLVGEGALLLSVPGWLPIVAAGSIVLALGAIAFRDNPNAPAAAKAIADQALTLIPGSKT